MLFCFFKYENIFRFPFWETLGTIKFSRIYHFLNSLFDYMWPVQKVREHPIGYEWGKTKEKN